ncbi:MAG: DUF4276 family protein [Planctomycetes bacterium]|nr:DUF4276 family protein [Planctomycetota bacterium]
MLRLLVHVEGQTEESFVNEMLAPHLQSRGYASVTARLAGSARQREKRGGVRAWSAVRKDILNRLKEDKGCLATTMFDYYRLPKTGQRAWPGRLKATKLPLAKRAEAVEKALSKDIADKLGNRFDPTRFIPFIVIHEFEGLLFSDSAAFARGIGRPELAEALQNVRETFGSPEEINDSEETAPSKRVLSLMPEYVKPIGGTLAALEVGLDAIRHQCPHFRAWLDRLEARTRGVGSPPDGGTANRA